MKKILFISLLAITTSIFGQSSALDIKAGFKNFKIGDSKSKFSVYLKDPTTPPDGMTIYSYESNNETDYSVFGRKFDVILLGFDKNDKLQYIDLIKFYDNNSYNKSLEEFSNISDELVGLFEKPSKITSDESKASLGYLWQGNKVTLTIDNRYKGVSIGSTNSICIFNNSIESRSTDF